MEKSEVFVWVEDGGDEDDEEDEDVGATVAPIPSWAASRPISLEEEEDGCCFGRRIPGNMRWGGTSVGRGGGGAVATAVDKSMLQCPRSLVAFWLLSCWLHNQVTHTLFMGRLLEAMVNHPRGIYHESSDVRMLRDNAFTPSDSFRLERDGGRR